MAEILHNNLNNRINLIVNADDYGYTPGVSAGILDAHLNGIVSTTTAMMNAPNIQTELEHARIKCPKLGLGVHLVLTKGKPLSFQNDVETLIDEQGSFFSLEKSQARLGHLNVDQVYREWSLQIESFMETGIEIDHLDSHHHISYLDIRLFDVMLKLADRYSAPIRFPPPGSDGKSIEALLSKPNVKHPDETLLVNLNSMPSESLEKMIRSLKSGVTEFVTHPGFADDQLLKVSKYNYQREKEYKLLTNLTIKEIINERGIELTTFSKSLNN